MRKHFILLSLLILPLAWCANSWAESGYTASIRVSEEYNDNVNETTSPRSDFITVITPSVSASYVGGRVSGTLSYSGDFRHYANNQLQDEMLNNLEAQGLVQVVEKVVVVDVSDSNHMVFNNAAQGQTNTTDSTRNQVNQNVIGGGVTITPNLADRLQASAGYHTSGTLYSNTSNTTTNSAINKYTQEVFANTLSALTPKLDVGVNLQGQRQNADRGGNSSLTATVVGRYTYADQCYIFGQFGALDTHYDSGTNSLLPTWSAGLTHTLGKTILYLNTQGSYVNNPSSINNSFQSSYSATVAHQFDRASISANAGYSELYGQGTPHSSNFTAGLQFSYELTPRLSASLSGSRVNSLSNQNNNILVSSSARLNNNNSSRWYGSAELNYILPKNFSVNAYYRYKFSDTVNNTGSYAVNVVGLGLQKSF